ncbi:helix-turn-helix domain-containing protein [Arthrobacter sp. QXT-31]|uniref:helix-turn-helix domain-containing protein n=1 Tax=Arthrobacter sp. QXT-31 TaxID=1357915 RepID=UPI0012FACD96|nr:helix-turn-helix domain-containing protein [Arthrobacter sp. QXT-31]
MVLTTQSNNGRRVAQGPSANTQLVSDANNSSQHKLLMDLAKARMMRGLTVQKVAELLGATTEIVEDIESGDYEPNLTELRQYAYAIEAVVEFRVHACAVESLSRISEKFWRHGSVSDDLWVHVSWSDAMTERSAASAVIEIVRAENG